ncbi:TadE/TadG family type IV pilus assembly protein [Streptomyces sp. H10-C2]|uniref:TadE/TadG family type IV pilus assembly protein n=1 Tax=unclassified Streptomyces TaxID=2593676 RepID=UPI0024BA7AAD|nr:MULTISPECIES: TadE/TadG family type IV pilus assembly protein [unclassified Streptomyces]MDJ0342480.1 TadE/TadG family type IV pilus assembly protein [Streptomyces sp. PH10-H1]MDJ0372335.1 TadE/TadG family type IV pilus assembly protein [Streptomyces sp. H10-C2]
MRRRLEALVRRRLQAASGDSGVGKRAADDRGMTAIEFVFLTPVLFFMIFATVQFGLYFFADHVAQAAAQAGAREARAEADANPDGWRAKAVSKADSYIQQLGPQLLTNKTVETIRPDPNNVGVHIRAEVPQVFPGLHFTVDALSQGPVERFVPDGG